MAKLTALQDLKKSFDNFDEMSKLIDDIRSKTDEIERYNKEAGGGDDLGKQYHSTVDGPSKNLSALFKKVRDTVDNAGKQGSDTSDLLNAADQNAKDQV